MVHEAVPNLAISSRLRGFSGVEQDDDSRVEALLSDGLRDPTFLPQPPEPSVEIGGKDMDDTGPKDEARLEEREARLQEREAEHVLELQHGSKTPGSARSTASVMRGAWSSCCSISK